MTVARALVAAFTAQLRSLDLVRHHVTPWHSATFAGGRHVFEFVIDEPYDLEAFERCIGELDIAVPRGFVADVAVTKGKPHDARALTIEVLTIDA